MMKYNCLLTETNIYVLHLWILVALSRHEIVLQTLFRVKDYSVQFELSAKVVTFKSVSTGSCCIIGLD